MTKGRKFVSIEDFHENATKNDIEELFEFYLEYLFGGEKFPTKEESNPKCRFQFSAAAAKQELQKYKVADTNGKTLGDVVEIAKKKLDEVTTRESLPLKFVEKRQKFDKRSVMMTPDHWDKLQNLYEWYPTRDKSYVLHAFLEHAFSSLGL